VALIIRGLSPAGFLLAEEEETGTACSGGSTVGKLWELTPDGNSLDMISGLIRKKLAPGT
jgi:biotin--protein ligase